MVPFMQFDADTIKLTTALATMIVTVGGWLWRRKPKVEPVLPPGPNDGWTHENFSMSLGPWWMHKSKAKGTGEPPPLTPVPPPVQKRANGKGGTSKATTKARSSNKAKQSTPQDPPPT